MTLIRRRRMCYTLVVCGIGLWLLLFLYEYPESNNSPMVLNADDHLLTRSLSSDNDIGHLGNLSKRQIIPTTNEPVLNQKVITPLTTSPSVRIDMLTRKLSLHKTCRTSNHTSSKVFKYSFLDHLIVNDKKKILYCFIPKIANTNFRRIFLGLQGDFTMTEALNMSGYDIYSTYADRFVVLKNMTPPERQKRLKTYKKFLFVRDPLERLLSAYRNKFFHPDEYQRWMYYEKLLDFYKYHPQIAKENKVRTTFEKSPFSLREFLIYWTSMIKTGAHINEHFVPYNDLCRPCTIKYDFIGKFESLDQDVKYTFSNLNIDVEFPARSDNYTAVETRDIVEEAYKDIPCRLLKEVYAILKIDFQLFGYEVPKWFDRNC